MPEDLFLAIDQGGQSTRAILFDRCGQTFAASSRTVATRRHGPAQVEHDPEEILSSVVDTIAQVCSQAGLQGRMIAKAGLATQRSSIVCWDKRNGNALSPVISWQDTRAAALLQQLSPDTKIIRRITGLVRSPHYGASKLRWCLENIEAVASANAAGHLMMGPLSSFILCNLLDSSPLLVDPVNASRTLLWDCQTLDWSAELLKAFAIPVAALPTCVANQHSFGHIKNSAIPLHVCTGDQNAAIFAAGDLRPGVAYLNIGTGAFVLAQVDDPVKKSRLLHSVIWSDGAAVTRVLEGTVNGAGSALAAHQATPSDIDAAAAAISTADIPLYLNGHSGLGSPFWLEKFTCRFITDGDSQAKLTAVIESILFLIQVNLEQIFRSTTISTIVISGGLSRNDDICQGMADLSGLTVSRPAEAEATARGLAYLVSGRPSSWQGAKRVTFEPACGQNVLRQRFSAWLTAMANEIKALDAASA